MSEEAGANTLNTKLPAGTVTFLFTDIEGSTKLLERLREQYAALLDEQRELLRGCFYHWNGYEIDTQGDSFFVAFPRALDAVQCVIEAQRLLAEHTWPKDAAVRVRMGLHTGEPLVRSAGYVGMDVHRAARIAATGSGGQVLLSQTTRDLVAVSLPEGARLRDLGAHRLKDLPYPQQIYQLDIAGLPAEFLPLRSLEKLDLEELPPAPGNPPYKGLQCFTEADTDWFFGRGVISQRIAEAVRSSRFVAVIGASGSGKSSVVRAGVVPLLRQDAAIDWQIHVITPTAHPLEALAVNVTRRAESVTATATLIDDLQAERRSLHLYAHRLLGSEGDKAQRLLIVVDQLEEVFTQCRIEAERQAFIDNLVCAVESQGGVVTVLITLRADFYAQVAQYPALREQIAGNQVYIGTMNAVELKEAIEAPANRGGWELSPGLVELMLHDIGAVGERQPEPGALPLLSHALLETWKRRRGNLMSLRAYTEAGGVRGAIARTADRVYTAELDARQQEVARGIFLRLTELGEGTEDTRRRMSIQELIPPGPAGDTEQIQGVLLKLADARLVTIGEGTVEVAHEALIREWPRLREWLVQDREGLRLSRHLTEAAAEWELLEHDPSILYRGIRLAGALEWAFNHPQMLSAREQTFLNASQQAAEVEQAEKEAQRQRELEAARALAEAERLRAEEQSRANRKLRQRAVYLGVALIVALGLAAVALWFFNQASHNANLATSRELSAAAINALNIDPELSVLLSLEALDSGFTKEAENALHASLPALHLRRTIPMGEEIETLALSPDGRTLAAGEGIKNGDIQLLDSETGALIRRIETGQRVIFGLSFSPDNRRLASVDWDGNTKIWDTASGEQLLAFYAHDGGASRVAFSPDGSRIATGGDDATAKVWDSTSGELLLTLSGHSPAERIGSLHPGGVVEVAYSPDGSRIATGGADGTVRLWEAMTGEEMQVYQGHANEMNIAFSPDGSRLVSAGADGYIKTWDTSPGATSNQPLLLINHEQPARSVAYSPDGTRIAVASQDGASRMWDATTGVRQTVLVGHMGNIDDLVFSADSSHLYTGSADGTVKVWDLAPGREVFTIPGRVPIYSPDGQKLAISYDGQTRIADAATGATLIDLPIGEQPFTIGATYSPDGSKIGAAGWGGNASIWDALTGKKISTLAGHQDRVWKVVFNPAGNLAATSSDDDTVKVWDVITGEELFTLTGHTDDVQGVNFSPDGERIATASWDKTVRIWDTATGEQQFAIEAEAELNDVVFHSDGNRVAASTDEGAVYVWDISQDRGELLYELLGHTAGVVRLDFSPDGRYLATPSFDGTLKLWEMSTGEEWLSIKVSPAYLTDLSFSPIGRHIAVGGFEGMVRVFSLDLQEVIALAKSRLTRTLTEAECQKYLHLETCPEIP